jgi:hypothetical protein
MRFFENLFGFCNQRKDPDVIIKTPSLNEDGCESGKQIEPLPLFDVEQLALIPIELWRSIICFLTIDNFYKLMLLNKGWYAMVDDETSWRHVYEILHQHAIPEHVNDNDERFWKHLVKSYFGWTQFSDKHIDNGLILKDRNRTVCSQSNRSFAPVIIKNPLPHYCAIEIEFSFKNLSSIGYTGVGIATEEQIFPTNSTVNQSLSSLLQGYIGQYNGINRSQTNIGYFENGYMSCNHLNIGPNGFYTKYVSDDIVKIVVNPLVECFDIEDEYYGTIQFFLNNIQIGETYKAFKKYNQKVYVVVNVEGNQKTCVTIKQVRLKDVL